MDGHVRAENTKLLLASILREATAADPALVVVEDAHWLDSNSWALLLEVVQSVPRLLVVVTTRPTGEPTPEEYDRLCAAPETRSSSSRRSARARLGALVEPAARRRRAAARADRFVEARVVRPSVLLRASWCRRCARPGSCGSRTGRRWSATSTSLDVPATIEGAVLSRIDRLTLRAADVPEGRRRDRPQRSCRARSRTALAASRPSAPGCRRISRCWPSSTSPCARRAHRSRRTRSGTRSRATSAYELLTSDPAPPAAPRRRRVARARPTAPTSWRRTTRCSPITGRAPTIPDRAVDLPRARREQALRSGAFREALLFLSQRDRGAGARGTEPDPIRDALCQKGMRHRALLPRRLPAAAARCCTRAALAQTARCRPPAPPRHRRGLAGAAATQAAHLRPPGALPGAAPAAKPLIAEALGCYKIARPDRLSQRRADACLLYGTLAGLNLGEEAGPSPDLARMLIHAATASSLVGLQAAGRPLRRAGRSRWSTRRASARRARTSGASRRSSPRTAATGRTPSAPTPRRSSGIGEVGDFNLEAEVWQTRVGDLASSSGAFGAAEAAWTRHRELAERNGNAQNLLLVAARRGADARRARRDRRRRRARSRAALADPDAEQRRQQHGREALHHGASSARAQGRYDEAVARGRRGRGGSSPAQAAVGLPLCRVLRRGSATSTSRRSSAAAAATSARCCSSARSAAAASCGAPSLHVRQRARRGAGCCRGCSSGSADAATRAHLAWRRAERDRRAAWARRTSAPARATSSRVTARAAPSSARSWPSAARTLRGAGRAATAARASSE